MKRFSKIEAVVTNILETIPSTRSDDYLLMLFVTEQMKPCLLDKTLDEVLSNHYKNGLPNWESVTRTRRKIQSRRPDLCDDRTIRKRSEREKVFREYARA